MNPEGKIGVTDGYLQLFPEMPETLCKIRNKQYCEKKWLSLQC